MSVPQPAYKAVAERIEGMLAEGELRPGDPLPNEASLAERFDVNRSTIRESLRLLEDSGYVVRTSPRKLVAALPTAVALAPRTTRALWVNRVTVRDVYEANLAIEPAMARAAADRASEAQRARLAENIVATRAQLENGGDLNAFDEAFHALIGEASNNQALIIAREPMKTLFLPVVDRLVEVADTGARLVDAHSRINEAIQRRDGDVAELWARRHLEDFERGCRSAGVPMNVAIDPVSGKVSA